MKNIHTYLPELYDPPRTHEIFHFKKNIKLYQLQVTKIKSAVFKIYDRDGDRGPRSKNPTARDRDRDITSEKYKTPV